MSKQHALATKLPIDLLKTLGEVCEKFGLKKNFVVETALREKLEDILDTHDLKDAMKEASAFHDWKTVKQEVSKMKRRS